jgi:hypothetical protein
VSERDITERLAAEFAPEHDGQIVLSTTVDADLLRDAKAEIERLRAHLAAERAEVERLRADPTIYKHQCGHCSRFSPLPFLIPGYLMGGQP